MREEQLVTGAVALAGTAATAIFGAWDEPLKLLLLAMVIDYITGLVSAAYRGDLSSAVGLRGLARKIGMVLLVAVANLADRLLAAGAGEYLAIDAGAAPIRTAACFALAFNELVSVLENLGETGVPIPEPLRRMVRSLKGGGDDGSA